MKFTDIKSENLSRGKLSLISFGSVGGMGLGLLISFVFNSPISRLIIAIILMSIAIWSVYKSLPYMVINN